MKTLNGSVQRSNDSLESVSGFSGKNAINSELLFDLIHLLGRQDNYKDILDIILKHAKKIFATDFISLNMINPRTRHTLRTVIKTNNEVEPECFHLLKLNIIGWVSKNNAPFMTNDLKNDKRFQPGMFDGTSAHSVLCVPVTHESALTGYVLMVNSESAIKFYNQHLFWARRYASLIAPYLTNPQNLNRYFQTQTPDSELLQKYEKFGLIGKSQKFINMLKAVESAARCDVRVLLEGNSGTGKELVARAIHQLSNRGDKPFIALDCGAIPENLIESELFGHVKGAFTGATGDRCGLFQEANGGTLFIDEISNLPLSMQVKLLRVLQEEEIRILGSNVSRKVDVRVISAASSALHEKVQAQEFREDLYFRLHVYPIVLPCLNDRPEDIPLLAHHFVRQFSERQKKAVQHIAPAMVEFLTSHNWRGNIRELENFMELMVTVVPADSEIMELSHLPEELYATYNCQALQRPTLSKNRSLSQQTKAFEKNIILSALRDANGNQSQAARNLNISERTMRYKIRKLAINTSL